MSTPSIHGNLLYVTVTSCNKLKDTEWISRQDPFVCIEYGGNRSQTRTCTDGGKNPTFQEKFVYILVEGLRELNVDVWNSNNFKHDDFIGSAKVPLSKVLSKNYDDSHWPLKTRNGRHAGEVRLIMEYDKTPNNHAPVVEPQHPHLAVAGGYPVPASASAASYPYQSYPQNSAPHYQPQPAPQPFIPNPAYFQPAPYLVQPYPPYSAYAQPPPYPAQPGPSNPAYSQSHESYHDHPTCSNCNPSPYKRHHH